MIGITWHTLFTLLELSSFQECERYLEKQKVKQCVELIRECVLDEGINQFEFCRDDVLESL